MAPKNATTGAQDRYCTLCPPAPKHTTDGPQKSEYSWTAKAAEVTWKDGPVTYRTWVWSSAVTRREEMMNRNLGERTRGKNSK